MVRMQISPSIKYMLRRFGFLPELNNRMAAFFSFHQLWGPRSYGGPVFCLLAVTFLFCGGAYGDGQETQKAQPKAATYVGSQTCQMCHEDIYNAIEKSPHAVVGKSTRWGRQDQTCEACHGPGSIHVETLAATDIKDPAKLPAMEADRICLKCHLNQPTQVGRIRSSHARDQVSCVACHSVHKPGALVVRRMAVVNQLCAGCHTSIWAQFQRPYKHRLPEGAMSCVDCHNPHGSFFPQMQRTFAANEPGCLKCHGDKRGPFAYEHAPVRVEGCTACHQPHGSANPRMLTRQEVRFVCLECHANLPLPTAPSSVIGGVVPPSFHDLRTPRYQNCTTCHVKIHGSHVSGDFLR
jgi:DmsE family decaheme c-type cytochrome